MKVSITQKVWAKEEVSLSSLLNVPLYESDNRLKDLIEEFLDTSKWKLIASTCHSVFKDFPTYSQGGTNGSKLTLIKVIQVTKHLGRCALKVQWQGKDDAVIIMELVNNND